MAKGSGGIGKWLSILVMVVTVSVSLGTLIYAAGIQGERVKTARETNDKQDLSIKELVQANSNHRESQAGFEAEVRQWLKSIEEKANSIDKRLSSINDVLQEREMNRNPE